MDGVDDMDERDEGDDCGLRIGDYGLGIVDS
jgi:hypothetical protein